MSGVLRRASENLRGAKLRLQEAKQLIATAGDVGAKNDIDKVLSHVERMVESIDRQRATILT